MNSLVYIVAGFVFAGLGADVISFDGHGVISYRFRSKKVKILKDVISLKFRTTSENGVLLHGEGQQGDYISLELRRARLQLSINLGSETTHCFCPSTADNSVVCLSLHLFLFHMTWILCHLFLGNTGTANVPVSMDVGLLGFTCELLIFLQAVISMDQSRATQL